MTCPEPGSTAPGRRLEEEGARLRGVPPSTQAAEPHPRDRAHRDRRRGRRPDLPGRPRRAARSRARTRSRRRSTSSTSEAEQATEKYNGAKEKQEKLEKEVGAPPGQGRARPGRPQQAARRPRFDGHRPVPHRRHRPVRAALPLLRPGQLPRQGLHARPAERQAGRGAEEDPGASSATLAQQRKEATDKLQDLADTRKELGKKKKEVQGKLAEAQKLLNTLTAAGARRSSPPRTQQRASRASERVDLGNDAAGLRPRRRRLRRRHRASSARRTSTAPPAPAPSTAPGLTSWAYAQAGVSITAHLAGPGQRRHPHRPRASSSPATWSSSTATCTTSASTRATARSCTPRSPAPVVRYESMDNMPFQFGVRV